MDFYQAVKQRRSIRRFKPDEIPAQVIEDIMQVATLSADSCYADRYRVLAVSRRETIERMRAACIETIERRVAGWTEADEASWAKQGIPFPKHEQIGTTQRDHYRYFSMRFDTFFGEAPIVLAMATQPLAWQAAPHVWPTLQLAGSVMQTIQLAAVEKGIGACCMTGPLHSRQALLQILGLEPPWEIVALMPMGVPTYEPAPRPRKPLTEVLSWLGTAEPGGESTVNVDSVSPVSVELSEVLRRRSNVYHFYPDPVPKAEVQEIIRIATLAPNSLNQQKWRFVAITARQVLEGIRDVVVETAADMARYSEKETRALFDEMAFLDGPESQDVRVLPHEPGTWVDLVSSHAAYLAKAPTVIAVLNESLPSGATAAGWSDIESIGCAVETLMLAAAARGYGSGWMTSPLIAWQYVDKVVGARDPWRTVALVPLGLPREEAQSREAAISSVFTWVE